MGWFTKDPSFASLTRPPTRDELVRKARVALLDDDTPEVLEDLRASGFAVDHIKNVSDRQFGVLESGLYHLLLLDFGGIGTRVGADEGLDVLKHLRRVSPSLRIVAFTGRTFDASKADFFRKCDQVLKKDAGIRETLEAVEAELAIALTPAHQWKSLLTILGLSPDDPGATSLEKALHKAARRPGGPEDVKTALAKYGGATARIGAEMIAGRLLEYAASALLP